MSEEIIKVLNDLGERFGIVIDWTSQNIMPYLQELASRFITYRNVTGITQIIIFITLIAMCGICIKALIKWKKSDKFDNGYCSDDSFTFWLLMILIAIFIIIFGALIICNIFGIIQNICMPELTIIEYLKNYM